MVSYKDGYKLETTRGTATFADYIELATFKKGDKMPVSVAMTAEYNALESYGADLAISKGNQPLDRVTVQAIALDEIPFYCMLVDVDTWDETLNEDDEFELTFEHGNKPSMSIYHKLTHGAWVGKGIVLESLDWDMNFGTALSYQFSGKGMDQELKTTSFDLTLLAPEDTDIYDTLTPFTFNYDDAHSTKTYDMTTCGGKMAQSLEPLLGQSGKYQAIVDTSKVTQIIQVLFAPNIDLSTLFARLDLETDTPHDFGFTIASSKNPEKYMKFTGKALLYDLLLDAQASKADQRVGLFVVDGSFTLKTKGGAL
jgi:hypothetical protein